MDSSILAFGDVVMTLVNTQNSVSLGLLLMLSVAADAGLLGSMVRTLNLAISQNLIA